MEPIILCDNIVKRKLGFGTSTIISEVMNQNPMDQNPKIKVHVTRGFTNSCGAIRSHIITVTISVSFVTIIEAYYYDREYDAIQHIIDKGSKDTAGLIFEYILSKLTMKQMSDIFTMIFKEGTRVGELDFKRKLNNLIQL